MYKSLYREDYRTFVNVEGYIGYMILQILFTILEIAQVAAVPELFIFLNSQM